MHPARLVIADGGVRLRNGADVAADAVAERGGCRQHRRRRVGRHGAEHDCARSEERAVAVFLSAQRVLLACDSDRRGLSLNVLRTERCQHGCRCNPQ